MVNKKSLREEFDRIKIEFEQLSSENKVPTETKALFSAMFMLFELVLAIFLEKTTPKTNKNSSLPSSQTLKDDTATSNAKSNTKGKLENGERFSNSRTREAVRLARVSVCDHCGEDLSLVACQQQERRTKIDIVFEKVVLHVDAEIKECPHCHGKTKGAFPADMPGPRQYGVGIKAYALNLLISQMITLNRLQKLVQTLTGEVISEATFLGYITQLDKALEQWEADSIHQLLTCPALHVDETSLRVAGKNHWIHVYAAGDITLKFLHAKRGTEAIEAINIIPRYGGTTIHDCWASYLSYEHCNHGLCGSHLLRELTFVVESNHYAWAANMKHLLQETSAKVARRKRKKLSEAEYKQLQRRYRTLLTQGETELPPIPARSQGQRGKIAKSDAHNLWERLRHYETAVLLFAREPEVAFTNNRAEQDLRMAKVKQKVSGCFRKEHFAQAYCRISSYLQTMANKGYNPMVSIQLALSGQVYADRGE